QLRKVATSAAAASRRGRSARITRAAGELAPQGLGPAPSARVADAEPTATPAGAAVAGAGAADAGAAEEAPPRARRGAGGRRPRAASGPPPVQARVASSPEGPGPDDEAADPHARVFRLLEATPPAALGHALATATALVVPLRLIGVAPWTDVRFVYLSGRARTPLQGEFTALLAARRGTGGTGHDADGGSRLEATTGEFLDDSADHTDHAGGADGDHADDTYRADRADGDHADHAGAAEGARGAGGDDAGHADGPDGVGLPPRPMDDEPLGPSDKLCGDQLASFGGFLSARWRANDWMWGRLDASSTLIEAFLEPARLRQRCGHAPEAARAGFAELLGAAWDKALDDRFRRGLAGDDDALSSASESIWHALVSERQRVVLREELPVVASAGHAPTPARATPRPEPAPSKTGASTRATGPPITEPSATQPSATQPSATQASVADYTVGLEDTQDLGDRRRMEIGMRLGLVAFGALRPDGHGIPAITARWGLSLLKPLYLALLFVLLSLRRGLLVVAAAVGALQLTFWQLQGTPEFRSPLHVATTVAAGAALAGGSAWMTLTPIGRSRERPGWLVAAGALVGSVALVVYLAPVGVRYLTLLVLDAALVVLAAWRWRAWHQRRRTGPDRDQLWYPTTILVVLAAALAGATRWPVGHTIDGWGDLRFVVLALLLVATAVTVAGTFWMRPVFMAVAATLTVGCYLGALSAFEPTGNPWPGWIRWASYAGILVTVLVLTVFAALDHRRRRAGAPGVPIVPLAVGLGAGAAWLLLARQHLGWPMGGWGTVAIVAAAYALTALATYAEVMPPRPRPGPH
ncbi:MAG: DUF3376 domain-containing protein, partial [Acidimicrobiia bacterium]|nr:DUF3376 domain-containing protein [Acidimicrobiia bacterium]